MKEEKTSTKKLTLRKATLQDLSGEDLAQVAGGGPGNGPLNQCACTTDFSNNCCGPNGSC